QASTVHEINPGRGGSGRSLRLNGFCCWSNVRCGCGFLVPVFDLTHFAMGAFRSSLQAGPKNVAFFPCVIYLEACANPEYDSLANEFTGLVGFRRTLRDEGRAREEH